MVIINNKEVEMANKATSKLQKAQKEMEAKNSQTSNLTELVQFIVSNGGTATVKQIGDHFGYHNLKTQVRSKFQKAGLKQGNWAIEVDGLIVKLDKSSGKNVYMVDK